MNPFHILFLATALAGPQTGEAPAPDAGPARAAPAADEAAERALAAINDFDQERIFLDQDYARQMLGHADALMPLTATRPELSDMILGVRLMALVGLRRDIEALDVAKRLAASRPDEPSVYGAVFQLAAVTHRTGDALEAVEQAQRNLSTPEQRAPLYETLDAATVSKVARAFREASDKGSQWRLAEALVSLGWPGPDQVQRRDWQRLTAIEGRLTKGDVAGAKAHAADITTPQPLARLLVARKYDALFEPGFDRPGAISRALARYDGDSARRLEAKPADLDLLLERAQFLRAANREEEALAVLLPAASDMAKVEQGGERAFWIVNEAAYALAALGRGDEAVALMEKLVALGVDKHPPLISMAINQGEVLNSVGRHREAAAHAERLFAASSGWASDYGDMWMWSIAACGHAEAGNRAAAASWLERLESASAGNESAHMRALLCIGDLDGAERLLLRRLEGDEAPDVLLKLQNYTLRPPAGGFQRRLEDKWMVLRARPSVAAAIARTGRILDLPLSKTYWGDY